MHGGVVILGRGGNFILADRADLRVRLVASEEARIRTLMAETNCAEREAAERIAHSDEARGAFIRKLYHAEIDDPTQYDLVINTTGLERERLPELAMLALEARGAFAGGGG
jgi:cytidylate kinase